ncbi:MAG: LysE family transporter [Legionella sp.]|uniref:LysE family translocator n=1 Tax=Legionella sp. TaxID=459 RepID=UPI00283B2EC5|nr:LysE family transporter [Legionella sp.]
MINLIIYGLIIGILVSAPIGPIAALCVQRSLNLGFKAGFITGLGSALADGVFGLITACGLTFISEQLTIYQAKLQCLSGFILLYLGIKQYLKNPKTPYIKEHQQSPWHFLIGAFLLSLSNSAAILLFFAVLATLGLDHLQLNMLNGSILIVSIVLGSSLVWLMLSAAIAFILKKHVNSDTLCIINFVFGTTFLILGIVILAKLIAFS